MALPVLLYVPNIIDYIRFILLVVSWVIFYSDPMSSFICYAVSACLDFVDGYAARKLNQSSAFGAWLDVVIDIFGRGMLWCRIYHFGYLVAGIEWLTFVCTHTLGSEWKSSFIHTPWWVKGVMANNFKSPMGVTAISGLHVLPITLYGHYMGVFTRIGIPSVIQYLSIALLSAGRALCLAVELWCIWSHVLYLTRPDTTKDTSNEKMASASS